MVKVTQINLEVNGQTISLSPEEAHELLDALKTLLEPEPEIRYVPGPTIIERPYVIPWTYTRWTITSTGQSTYSLAARSTVE